MLILLSPAKNLNFDAAPDALPATKPAMGKDTAELAEVAKGLTRGKLKTLMGISEKLADLNLPRVRPFATSASSAVSLPIAGLVAGRASGAA
ncbi:MAG: peroxide stress protein YaaA, partial [Pseudomonadota bacterium]